MREQLQAENVGETRGGKSYSVPEADPHYGLEPLLLGQKGSQATGAISEVLRWTGPRSGGAQALKTKVYLC